MPTAILGLLASLVAAAPPTPQTPCEGDLNADRVVESSDLGVLLDAWGACSGCAADLNDDGFVNGRDLGRLLGGWGACPVATPAWATLIEAAPDPAVVTDPELRQRIVATGLAWRVRDTATDIEMMLIPDGTFDMGCSESTLFYCSWHEHPVHAVTLTNAFYLGRYEVTQAQWQARMGSNPSFFVAANGYPGSSSRPVERVSWNAVQGFLGATGMRLPSEAEWEYAYRAGTTTAFHGSSAHPSGTNEDWQLGSIAWFYGNSNDRTHPVGGKLGNGFGLHDMSGNVAEWVNDWFLGTYYASSPATDPPGPPSGDGRVSRGGPWIANSEICRSSARNYGLSSDVAGSVIGFRVARNP
jgi:formylglycine-generating enzyme required for sulfatase activity